MLPEDIEAYASKVPTWESFIEAGLISGLFIPLIWSNEVIGTLDLRSKSANGYSEEDKQVGIRLAKHLVGAVVNSRLHLNLAKSERLHSELARLSQTSAEARDLVELMQITADAISQSIEFDRADFAFSDEQQSSMTIAYQTGTDSSDVKLGTAPLIPDFTWDDPALFPDDVAGWNDIRTTLNSNTDGHEQSIIGCPLMTREGAIGVVLLARNSEKQFQEEELELLNQICAQVAPTIDILRLYEAGRKEAHIRETLAEIGRIVSSSLDFKDVAAEFSAQSRRLITCERFTINMFDEADGTIVQGYSDGLTVQVTIPGDAHRTDGTPAWRVVSKREIVNIGFDEIKDLEEQFPWMRPYSDAGLHSLLTLPLMWQGEVIGTLGFRSRAPEKFNEESVRIASLIASQIAGSMASSLLHATSLQLATQREERVRLDAENRELQEIERERGRFISTVSHELRTPLTSIFAFSDILSRNKSGHLDERELQQIDLVKKNARRLNLLIDDLFDVSKIKEGTFELNRAPFEVKKLIEELSESFSPTLAELDQFLSTAHPNEEVWIEGDYDRLAQVTSNLISNASKYSGTGSTIHLCVNVEDGDLIISVKDEGIGISKKDLRRLFTPFFRADNLQTRETDGTGLGLVVTKSIVELHGGTITVKSKPKKGSEFVVRIPGARIGLAANSLKLRAPKKITQSPHSRLDNIPE